MHHTGHQLRSLIARGVIRGAVGAVCGLVLAVFVAGILFDRYDGQLLQPMAWGAICGALAAIVLGTLQLGGHRSKLVLRGVLTGAVIAAVVASFYALIRSGGTITKLSAPYQMHGVFFIVPAGMLLGALAGWLFGTRIRSNTESR